MSKLIPLFGSLLVRSLHSTLRVRHIHAERIENTPQYIVSFWHAHLLMMLHCRFRLPIVTLSSRSKDGDISAGVFGYYGVECVRGSSTRGGGAALRAMIRAARDGKNLAYTPDGPRGPARILKDGVIFNAQATGLPIIPVAFAAKKKSCCVRGTRWSCHSRSRRRSSSTANRSPFRVTATSRNGARASSRP